MAMAKTLEHFDACIEQGTLFYESNHRIEHRRIDGIENKPAVPSAPRADDQTESSPNLGAEIPGSDINVSGLEVSKLGDHHVLCFNKFAAFRPHYLILTSDGFKRQWEPLGLDDFEAVYEFFEKDSSDHLVFFNCRAEAGCSRIHKHLQAIPKLSFDGHPWVNVERSIAGDIEPLPFAFTYERLSDPPSAPQTLKLYLEGLKQVEKALNLTTSADGVAPPHNVVMDRDRIMVIPRRIDGIGGIGANACGMLGMIWTQKQETMDVWLELGPRRILEAAGAPVRSTEPNGIGAGSNKPHN